MSRSSKVQVIEEIAPTRGPLLSGPTQCFGWFAKGIGEPPSSGVPPAPRVSLTELASLPKIICTSSAALAESLCLAAMRTWGSEAFRW